MENGREEESVRVIGHGVALVKADCRTRSRLSTTQKERRIYNTTTPLDRQLSRVRNISTLCLFSAKKSNPPLLESKGFMFHGTLPLIENVHTTSSVNESVEYVHIYSKTKRVEFAKQFLERWRTRLDAVEHAPHQLHQGHPLLDRLEHDAVLTHRALTNHQATIVADFRERLVHHDVSVPTTPFYINAGCSRQFALFVGPATNGVSRKINGKLGAMACPIVSSGDRAYKLSAAGCFALRGIDIPTDCLHRGKTTVMKNVARHTVHPEFLEMAQQLVRV